MFCSWLKIWSSKKLWPCFFSEADIYMIRNYVSIPTTGQSDKANELQDPAHRSKNRPKKILIVTGHDWSKLPPAVEQYCLKKYQLKGWTPCRSHINSYRAWLIQIAAGRRKTCMRAANRQPWYPRERLVETVYHKCLACLFLRRGTLTQLISPHVNSCHVSWLNYPRFAALYLTCAHLTFTGLTSLTPPHLTLLYSSTIYLTSPVLTLLRKSHNIRKTLQISCFFLAPPIFEPFFCQPTLNQILIWKLQT